ncbi:ABC-2 transporter permease, partial [Enterococcus faecalis]|nr:ABC-2 transporter permease [Enterococcus faecalis]
VSFIIFTVLSILIKGNINWLYGIQYLSLSIFIAIFFISIQYPFYYKFDYMKGSVMAILPYIACFAIGIPLINQLMKNLVFYENVMEVISYFQSNTVVLILMVLTLSLVLIMSSYLLSKKIQKKEF